MRARWPFQAFFFTAAFVYGLLAVGHFVDETEDVYPGDHFWTAAYLVACVVCVCAGAFEAKVVSGPRRWWWSVGLAVTPLMFAFRLVEGVIDQGLEAVEVGLLALWSAVGLVWAAHLIRLLPATNEEWDLLADEVRDLRRDVTGLREHVGLDVAEETPGP